MKDPCIAYRWLDDSESRPIRPEEFPALLIAGKIVTLGAQILGVDDKHFEIIYLNSDTLDNRRANLRAVPRTVLS